MIRANRVAVISPISVSPNTYSVLGDVPILSTARATLLYWDFTEIPQVLGGRMPQVEDLVYFLSAENVGRSVRLTESEEFRHPGSWQEVVSSLQNHLTRPRGNMGMVPTLVEPVGDVTLLQALLNSGDSKTTERRKVIELAILNALPVPPPDTPYAEILAFKRKRHHELNNLWDTVEDLAALYSSQDDLAYATEKAAGKVSAALAEIDRTMSERWSRRILRHIKTNFPAAALEAAAPLGGSFFATHSIDAISSGISGALPVLTAIVQEVKDGPFISESNTPFLYAYDANRQIYKPGS